jgi:hypothetical protein
MELVNSLDEWSARRKASTYARQQNIKIRANLHALRGIRTRDPVYEWSRTAPQTARPLDRPFRIICTKYYQFLHKYFWILNTDINPEGEIVSNSTLHYSRGGQLKILGGRMCLFQSNYGPESLKRKILQLNKKFWKELICLLSLHYLTMLYGWQQKSTVDGRFEYSILHGRSWYSVIQSMNISIQSSCQSLVTENRVHHVKVKDGSRIGQAVGDASLSL